MYDKKLSPDTVKKIDELVKRVAKKSGYSGSGELTYQEHLQMKLESVQRKMNQKFQKQRRKFGLAPKDNDFAEEIKTYLTDGISDLVSQGHSEKEALQITLDKFDEAELKPNFDDFLQEFESFGMEQQMEWYAKNGEAVGMFYAAFVMLGLTLGAFFGYLSGYSLISTGIGLAVGLGTGISLGLLSHAFLVTFKRK